MLQGIELIQHPQPLRLLRQCCRQLCFITSQGQLQGIRQRHQQRSGLIMGHG